jgi:hypothetical protein
MDCSRYVHTFQIISPIGFTVKPISGGNGYNGAKQDEFLILFLTDAESKNYHLGAKKTLIHCIIFTHKR